MEATPQQERYFKAMDTVHEALRTKETPKFPRSDDSLGYARWDAFHKLLDCQKDLLKEIDDLQRTFKDARPYIEGESGYFNQLGLVQGTGSRIDVYCVKFDMLVDAALKAETAYQEAQES